MDILPLAWLGDGDGDRYRSADFVIMRLDNSYCRVIWRLLQADFGTTYRGDFTGADSLEKAKDAAWVIHCRRINSWVSPVVAKEGQTDG
jgi:hypothetical protein